MSVYSPIYHAMVSSPAPPSAVARASPQQDTSVFHHLFEVVNPLQHLPVIGSLYRAVSGDRIGTVEKIAGDTLYGGLWGAVSSVAEVAFESLTGKSVEDTVLAWFKSDNSIAASGARIAAPAIVAAQSLPGAELPTLRKDGQSAVAPGDRDIAALSTALSAKGVDSATASRALYAYRRSLSPATPVLARVN